MSIIGLQPHEPWAIHVQRARSCERFMKSFTSTISGPLSEPAATPYRLPDKGQMVEVYGVKSRPDLNGALGEVVNAEVDAAGAVTVRVFKGDGQHGIRGGRDMKIQVGRLRSTSTPALPQLPQATGRSFSESGHSGSRPRSSAPSVSLGHGGGLGDDTLFFDLPGSENDVPPSEGILSPGGTRILEVLHLPAPKPYPRGGDNAARTRMMFPDWMKPVVKPRHGAGAKKK
jgi:hypothetical protein